MCLSVLRLHPHASGDRPGSLEVLRAARGVGTPRVARSASRGFGLVLVPGQREYLKTMLRSAIPIVLVSALVGCTSNAGSSSATPSTVSLYEKGGGIYVKGASGSPPVSLTLGYRPTVSPDGTTIAFLRDPRNPHYDGNGDPFVLQAWIIHVDGSGLRKLGQQEECCVGASASIEWSPDGSSVILTGGTQEQRLDVG